MKETSDIRIILTIDGMQCSMCETHVNDSVRRVSGVKKVKSSHIKNKTIIIASSDVVISEIKESITKEGYRILKEEIDPSRKKHFLWF